MKTEVEAVFLFIAELTGSFKAGTGTVEDKLNCGRNDYIQNKFHELDLENEEDRKDLHENIWLERLYDELDTYFRLNKGASEIDRWYAVNNEHYRDESYRWTVPIELDASALT